MVLSDSAAPSSPSSAFCPVSGPGLCRRDSPGQVKPRRALGELRVLLVAFLQKTVSPSAPRGAGEGARPPAFCLLQSPENWIPWRGLTQPSGFPSCRREPFQELFRGRLGRCAQAARPPQPGPPRSTLWDTGAARSPPAFCRKFWRALGDLQRTVGGPAVRRGSVPPFGLYGVWDFEIRAGKNDERLLILTLNYWMYLGGSWSCTCFEPIGVPATPSLRLHTRPLSREEVGS
nr:uncharacterized protein LOC131278473 [Dasypus novemcinctus]